MKKAIQYQNKNREEIMAELKKMRSDLQTQLIKSVASKNSTEYKTTRKNIARAMTALNALPENLLSTNEQK